MLDTISACVEPELDKKLINLYNLKLVSVEAEAKIDCKSDYS